MVQDEEIQELLIGFHVSACLKDLEQGRLTLLIGIVNGEANIQKAPQYGEIFSLDCLADKKLEDSVF